MYLMKLIDSRGTDGVGDRMSGGTNELAEVVAGDGWMDSSVQFSLSY
jgi:hypothetical protein